MDTGALITFQALGQIGEKAENEEQGGTLIAEFFDNIKTSIVTRIQNSIKSKGRINEDRN